jgi:hypothetical protein
MIKCWDLEANKVIRHYHGHLSGVYSLSLHPTLDVSVSLSVTNTCSNGRSDNGPGEGGGPKRWRRSYVRVVGGWGEMNVRIFSESSERPLVHNIFSFRSQSDHRVPKASNKTKRAHPNSFPLALTLILLFTFHFSFCLSSLSILAKR